MLAVCPRLEEVYPKLSPLATAQGSAPCCSLQNGTGAVVGQQGGPTPRSPLPLWPPAAAWNHLALGHRIYSGSLPPGSAFDLNNPNKGIEQPKPTDFYFFLKKASILKNNICEMCDCY